MVCLEDGLSRLSFRWREKQSSHITQRSDEKVVPEYVSISSVIEQHQGVIFPLFDPVPNTVVGRSVDI